MPKKKTLPTNDIRTLVIDGKDEDFLFTISYEKDERGRVIHDSFGNPKIRDYYYRPTEDQLFRYPRLKETRRKSLSKILDMILAATETYNPSNELFNKEFDKWLVETKIKAARPMRATSFSNAEINAKLYVKPYFEGYLIREVDDTQCRKMINALFTAGYSYSILKKAYGLVNEFLEYLYLKDVIRKNWMRFIKMPTEDDCKLKRSELGKKEKERHYMKNEEIVRIRKVLYEGYDAVQLSQENKAGKKTEYTVHKTFSQPEAFDLLLLTGLRTGELLALKYSNWDKNNGILNIEKGRVTYIDRNGDKNKLVTKDALPKNKASKSEIVLTEETEELLERMLKKEPEGYTGYIIHDKHGAPISVRSFEARFARAAAAAGVENISPHDIRHTFASIMKEVSGNDIHLIQKKLRHKDPTTTLNVYTEFREEKEAEFNEKVRILDEL